MEELTARRTGHRGTAPGWTAALVCLLPGVDAAAAAVHLSAVHEAVPQGRTCSIGVATWAPGEEPAATMRRADEALYAAEHAGRARTAVAEPAGNLAAGEAGAR